MKPNAATCADMSDVPCGGEHAVRVSFGGKSPADKLQQAEREREEDLLEEMTAGGDADLWTVRASRHR